MQETECGTAVEGEAGREWLFTVCDLDKSGKVTTQVKLLTRTRFCLGQVLCVHE